MGTGVQTEKLEKLVGVFDAEISSVNSWIEVNVTYYIIPDENSLINPKIRFGQKAFINNGIKPEKATKFKLGVYLTEEGYTTARVLNESEISSFQEPQTETEKLEQKLAVYRNLTSNSYVPYL